MPSPTWTYGGNPADSNTDAVRFAVGDTIKARPLLTDGEVDFCLAQNIAAPIPTPAPPASVHLAAAQAADAIAAKFSAEADYKVGDADKKFSQISKAYREMAKHYRSEACKFATVSFPALSRSLKRSADRNTDDVQPNFRVALFDNARAVQVNEVIDGVRDFFGFN